MLIHIEGWQEKIIARLPVLPVHANGNRYVGQQAAIQPDFPAQRSGGCLKAPNHGQRRRELTIDGECLRERVFVDSAAGTPQALDGFGNNIWVHLAQLAVDFDVAVIAIRGEADQGIGLEQSAEPVLIGCARRATVRFVDN